MTIEPQPNVPILKIAWTRYAQLDALSEQALQATLSMA